MNPFATLSGGLSTTTSARSGDASAGLTLPFTYQGSFQVGGSGSQRQEAAQSADASAGLNQNTLLIAAAVVVVVLIASRR